MKFRNWLKYFIYAVVLIVALAVINQITLTAREQIAASYNPFPYILLQPIIFTFLGMLLGGEALLTELRKKGKWKANKPKLVMLGIPFFYLGVGFSLLVLLSSINIDIGKLFHMPLLTFTNEGIFLAIFQLIFGYILVTSFYKTDEDKYNED